MASFAAVAVSLSSVTASASLPASDLSALSYDLNLKKRNQHAAPDRGFEAVLELDEDMFVPDAWNAMQRYIVSGTVFGGLLPSIASIASLIEQE